VGIQGSKKEDPSPLFYLEEGRKKKYKLHVGDRQSTKKKNLSQEKTNGIIHIKKRKKKLTKTSITSPPLLFKKFRARRGPDVPDRKKEVAHRKREGREVPRRRRGGKKTGKN